MPSDLVNAVLRVVWGQWTALGVAGTAPVPDQAIDLEALVSFTPSLQDNDPRLHDEALDWCVQHSYRLISLSRLRRLRSLLAQSTRDAYDAFAARVNATAMPKTPWPPGQSGVAGRTSEKSQPPDVERPELLQLQLRCMFGVTARADILMRFLRPGMVHETSPNVTLTTIDLDDLGYSKPAISEALADLTRGGVLERFRRANRDHYDLSRRAALLGMLGHALPGSAPNWTTRFRVLAGLIEAEGTTREKKRIVQADAIHKVFDRHREQLERLSVKPPSEILDWNEIAVWTQRSLLDD